MFSDLAKIWMMNYLNGTYGVPNNWFIQLRNTVTDENVALNDALFNTASMNGGVARLILNGNVDITIPPGKSVNYIQFHKANGALVYEGELQETISFPSGGTFRVQGTSTYLTLGNS